jgi:hypothetical protein
MTPLRSVIVQRYAIGIGGLGPSGTFCETGKTVPAGRILVTLTNVLLPQPVLSQAEVEAHPTEALNIGDPDSPIIAVMVDDPRTLQSRY